MTDDAGRPGTDRMPPGELQDAVRALKQDIRALSSVPRLAMLHHLTEPMYCEEVANVLGMRRQSAARHVDILRERGFVRALQGWRDTGPVTEFQVVPQRLFALGSRLTDLARLRPSTIRRPADVEPTGHLSDPQGGPTAGPPPREASLLSIGGPDAGKRRALHGGRDRWSIGRAEDADIGIPHDPFVSAAHAELRRDPRGHYLLDLHSSNGTCINFVRLPAGSRAHIGSGDVLTFGLTSFVYQAFGPDRGPSVPPVGVVLGGDDRGGSHEC